MSGKCKKTFSLSEKTVEEIIILSKETNVSQSTVVEKAVRFFMEEHAEHGNRTLEKLEEVEEQLNKIRLTGNVLSRESKMVLEFWNHYFFINEFNGIATTENYPTEQLKIAEHLVNKRIGKERKKKLDGDKVS